MDAGKENSLPTTVGGKEERSKVKTRKEKSQQATNTGERRRSGLRLQPVRSFKGAYLDENKKRDEREQSQIGGGEESGSTAQLQVTRGEGSTSSQERANEDRENVEEGRKVVDEEGNIQQVKVARVDTAEDVTVAFDLCEGFKETDSVAKMMKILAMKKELHVKNQRKVLLEMETEELKRKLQEETEDLKQMI